MISRLVILILALGFPMAVAAQTLTGTASYRERIALPPEAVFRAVLFDISNNKQIEIGRFEAPGDAGSPYTFTIEYDDSAVLMGGSMPSRQRWSGRIGPT